MQVQPIGNDRVVHAVQVCLRVEVKGNDVGRNSGNITSGDPAFWKDDFSYAAYADSLVPMIFTDELRLGKGQLCKSDAYVQDKNRRRNATRDKVLIGLLCD